jgi:hypothetical protein
LLQILEIIDRLKLKTADNPKAVITYQETLKMK